MIFAHVDAKRNFVQLIFKIKKKCPMARIELRFFTYILHWLINPLSHGTKYRIDCIFVNLYKKFYCFKLKLKCDRWRCDVFYRLLIGSYFLLYFLTTKKTLKIFCLALELNRGPMGHFIFHVMPLSIELSWLDEVWCQNKINKQLYQ